MLKLVQQFMESGGATAIMVVAVGLLIWFSGQFIKTVVPVFRQPAKPTSGNGADRRSLEEIRYDTAMNEIREIHGKLDSIHVTTERTKSAVDRLLSLDELAYHQTRKSGGHG